MTVKELVNMSVPQSIYNIAVTVVKEDGTNETLTVFSNEFIAHQLKGVYGSLSTAWDDWNDFFDAWTTWFTERTVMISNGMAYKAFMSNYNPISNYDSNEVETMDANTVRTLKANGNDITSTSSNGSSVSIKNGSEKDTNIRSGKESTTDTPNISQTVEKAGYNSTTPKTDTHTVNSGTTTSDTVYNNVTDDRNISYNNITDDTTNESTSSSNNTNSNNENEDTLYGYTRKLQRSGNIGVTTSQQMIQSELDLRMQNLFDYFVTPWIKRYCWNSCAEEVCYRWI